MNISPQLISAAASFNSTPTSKNNNCDNPADQSETISSPTYLSSNNGGGGRSQFHRRFILFLFLSRRSLIKLSGQSARTRCRNLPPDDSWNVLMPQSGFFFFSSLVPPWDAQLQIYLFPLEEAEGSWSPVSRAAKAEFREQTQKKTTSNSWELIFFRAK